MFRKLIIFFAILLASEMVIAPNSGIHVLQYSTQTFPIEMAKKDHFVMFYTPWCGYSRQLQPRWEELAARINRIEGGTVRIAKVDCERDPIICYQNGVRGYPTLKFFKAGRNAGIRFWGVRNLQSLMRFINQQTAPAHETQ